MNITVSKRAKIRQFALAYCWVSVLALATPPALWGQTTVKAEICKVTISTDGKLAITGDSERVIRVWDVPNRKLLRAIPDRSKNRNTIPHYAFSADGKFAVVGNRPGNEIGGIPATTLDPDTLTFWDLAAGVKLRSFELKNEPVLGVALSPDGKFALSSSIWKMIPRMPNPAEPQRRSWNDTIFLVAIRLWDTSTGKLMAMISDTNDGWSNPTFSPDGKFFASYWMGPTPPYGDKQTWAVRRWGTKATPDFGAKSMAAEFTRMHVNGMAWSPDGKHIAVSHGGLSLWNLETGKLVWTFFADREIVRDSMVNSHWPVGSVAFSSDGKRVVASSSWLMGAPKRRGDGAKSGILVIDTATGKKSAGFVGPAEVVRSVSFTSDGTMLLGASVDGLRFWDAQTGQVAFTLSN